MKNKYTLFGLASSLFIITGCAGGDLETNGNEEADGGEDQSSNGEAIDFWYIETGEAEEAILNAVERFEEENPEYTVDPLQIDNDDYKQRLVVAMSGGDPPDVFHSWGGGWLEEFVKGDQVKNLSETQIDSDRFVDTALDNSTFDGDIYGLPLSLSVVPIYYNQEIFEELDLSEPETYDELLGIIDDLNEQGYAPFALANRDRWPGSFFYMYFAERLGGEELFEQAVSGEGSFAEDEYIEAGEHVQELVEKEAFNSGFNGMSYDEGQSRQLLYTEQAAMIMDTAAFPNSAMDEYPEFVDNIGMFLFPDIEDGEGDSDNLVATISPTWSVYEDSENEEASVELVNHLTSTETAEEYAETSQPPAIEDVDSDDPFVNEFNEHIENADYIQSVYDQALVPSLAEVHLDTVQELLGLSMSPEEVAKMMEEEAEDTRD